MNHKARLVLVPLLLLAACTSPRARLPNIAKIYEQAALDEIRNPVVVIHGILGARLADRETKRTVWGAFTNEAYDPNTRAGARALALPLDPLQSAHDYMPEQERFYADGPLGALKVGLFFGVVSVQVYKDILGTLGIAGYTDPVAYDRLSPRYADDHFTCFTYWYDWRRDNVQNAIEFGRWLEKTRKRIRHGADLKIARLRKENTPKAHHEADELEAWLQRGYRFDIVAHSMGGLLARYYLRYGANDLPQDGSVPKVTWAGCKDIDKLIIVGTPNLGSIESLRNLTEGFQPAFLLPHFHQAILSTMPSIYQLLPRRRHRVVLGRDRTPADVDLFDPELWDMNQWGLLDESSDRFLAWLLPDLKERDARRAKAKSYLVWCLQRASQLHAALDKKPEVACPKNVYMFAGDAERTLTKTVLKKRNRRLVPTFPNEDVLYTPGDGTVPRYSALGDERTGGPYQRGVRTNIPWRNVTFLSDDHLGLTNNPTFSDNMLFILLEQLEAPAGEHQHR
ncbi:MAG: lipase family alpha/beta hydrolase [Planctomycetota bacterium]|jgi:pimeloyl-ACP methyl ester carboxylesterase